jgi:hypothetical protein
MLWRGSLMAYRFVFGNVWLLVAVTLHLGKVIEREEPTRYSFFGGGWLTPAAYALLELGSLILGIAFIISARRMERAESKG